MKKEVCDIINEINDMIDFIIYDGTTAMLGHEGKLVRNGALQVCRYEHHDARYIDTETVITDYIHHLFGKDRGYCNLFGMGGKYGHYIDYVIYAHGQIVYNVQVNVEPNLMYMSPASSMGHNDIDLSSEWYRILCEEFSEEKEKRRKKILKR